MTVALIADIVGSRRIPDRSAAQRSVESAAARVDGDLPRAIAPLHATVGDEFQAVYERLDDALAAILLLSLALPEGVACRFGLGEGEVHDVASTVAGIQDGSAWWAARAAIDALDAPARPSRSRSWFAVPAEASADARDSAAVVNAALLARDHIVGGMSDRARRLAYGTWAGASQQALAVAEGISQSAVSQSLARSGCDALLAGLAELVGHRS